MWLSQPHNVRVILAQELCIPRSGHPEVITDAQGTRVLSDGHTTSDLMVISLQKLQAYVGSDSEDFYGLFEKAVAKAKGEEPSEPFCDSCNSKGKKHLKTCIKVTA